MVADTGPDPQTDVESKERFRDYMDCLAAILTHPAQQESMRAYCIGLLLEAERKSIEPIATRLAPARVSSAHQALQHFIANARWSDEKLLARVRRYAFPAITKHAAIAAWIIDDTGIPKKGEQSVGVAHQYCGQLGKQANCQVAVTLSIANEHTSLPIAYRLYLPADWANNPARRKAAAVPYEIPFMTKPQIALQQIRSAQASGIPCGVVMADAAYGNDTDFRDELVSLGLIYVMDVQGQTKVWSPGVKPLPPKPWNGKGRKPTTLRHDADHQPVSVKELAMHLPQSSYEMIEWREGTAGVLSSCFAAVRVRAAHGETHTQRAEEWLLIEWPISEKEPTKYKLSTLPRAIHLKELVQTAHLRWRIERDFQELKGEFGLNHYEGRSWLGFHHHASMCIAAYGFLLAERGLFSPSRRLTFAIPAIPSDHRPRGFANHHRKT
jgi:SRSO17 transposase